MTFDVEKVIESHEAGWEYLVLFGEARRLMSLDEQLRRDYEIGFAPRPSGAPLADVVAVLELYLQYMAELPLLFRNLERAFSSEIISSAAGAIGEDGDEEALRHLGSVWGRAWAALYQWGNELRSTPVPDHVRKLFWESSRFVEGPARQVRAFVFDGYDTLEAVVADIQGGSPPPEMLSLYLQVEVDPDLSDQLREELERVISASIGPDYEAPASEAPVERSSQSSGRLDRSTVLRDMVEAAAQVTGVCPSSCAEISVLTEVFDADSLDLVEILMELEDRYGVGFDEVEFEAVVTVGEALDVICAKLIPGVPLTTIRGLDELHRMLGEAKVALGQPHYAQNSLASDDAAAYRGLTTIRQLSQEVAGDLDRS